MKHVINILVILILTFFVVGLTYIIHIEPVKVDGTPTVWGILYIPLIVLIGMWGTKLNNDY